MNVSGIQPSIVSLVSSSTNHPRLSLKGLLNVVPLFFKYFIWCTKGKWKVNRYSIKFSWFKSLSTISFLLKDTFLLIIKFPMKFGWAKINEFCLCLVLGLWTAPEVGNKKARDLSHGSSLAWFLFLLFIFPYPQLLHSSREGLGINRLISPVALKWECKMKIRLSCHWLARQGVNRWFLWPSRLDDITSSSKFSGSCVLTLQTISSTAFLFTFFLKEDFIKNEKRPKNKSTVKRKMK